MRATEDGLAVPAALGLSQLKIQAVIFDVYRTLLEVLPPPLDAEAQWNDLWTAYISSPPRLDLERLRTRCEALIAGEHAGALAQGISFPEVNWNRIVLEAVPELARLSAAQQQEFLFRHSQLLRSVRLAAGAAPVLRLLDKRGVLLGIASNAQPYTLRELDEALAAADLTRDLFLPSLCFWSFEHGFSKPDPHVFRILAARLALARVEPPDALMVGDRIDNDIHPSRAQGWQSWHLAPSARAPQGGSWEDLRAWIEGHL